MVMESHSMVVKMMRFKVGMASYQLLYLIQNLERKPALKILETLWKELLLSQINQILTGGLGAEARRRNTGREADHHRHHQGDTSKAMRVECVMTYDWSLSQP